MYLVKKINYIDGYRICLTFNDNTKKIVDLEPYLDKGIFLLLRNPDYFKMVRVIGHTLVWPNEADFCPDVLYEIGKEIQESKKKQIKRLAKSRRNTSKIKSQRTHVLAKKIPKIAKS